MGNNCSCGFQNENEKVDKAPHSSGITQTAR
jgi:hypothetical protein